MLLIRNVKRPVSFRDLMRSNVAFVSLSVFTFLPWKKETRVFFWREIVN